MKQQNPVFSQIEVGTTHYEDVDSATYKGITLKTGFLLLVTILVAALVVAFLPTILNNNPTGLYVALVVSSFVGLFAVMFGRLSTKRAKYAGVIYAACQGLFLGTITALCDAMAPGVATIAIFSTLIIFATMLILYASGIIRNGSFFRKLAYGLSFSVIGVLIFAMLYQLIAGPIQSWGLLIGLEAFLLIYGAVTLIFNFDEATYVVQSGCTKDAEWSVSLGLVVSILYIYVEALRLAAIIAAYSSDN